MFDKDPAFPFYLSDFLSDFLVRIICQIYLSDLSVRIFIKKETATMQSQKINLVNINYAGNILALLSDIMNSSESGVTELSANTSISDFTLSTDVLTP